MEASLQSATQGRVHLHWKVDLAEAIDHATTDAFAFQRDRHRWNPTSLLSSLTPVTNGTDFASKLPLDRPFRLPRGPDSRPDFAHLRLPLEGNYSVNSSFSDRQLSAS